MWAHPQPTSRLTPAEAAALGAEGIAAVQAKAEHVAVLPRASVLCATLFIVGWTTILTQKALPMALHELMSALEGATELGEDGGTGSSSGSGTALYFAFLVCWMICSVLPALVLRTVITAVFIEATTEAAHADSTFTILGAGVRSAVANMWGAMCLLPATFMGSLVEWVVLDVPVYRVRLAWVWGFNPHLLPALLAGDKTAMDTPEEEVRATHAKGSTMAAGLVMCGDLVGAFVFAAASHALELSELPPLSTHDWRPIVVAIFIWMVWIPAAAAWPAVTQALNVVAQYRMYERGTYIDDEDTTNVQIASTFAIQRAFTDFATAPQAGLVSQLMGTAVPVTATVASALSALQRQQTERARADEPVSCGDSDADDFVGNPCITNRRTARGFHSRGKRSAHRAVASLQATPEYAAWQRARRLHLLKTVVLLVVLLCGAVTAALVVVNSPRTQVEWVQTLTPPDRFVIVKGIAMMLAVDFLLVPTIVAAVLSMIGSISVSVAIFAASWKVGVGITVAGAALVYYVIIPYLQPWAHARALVLWWFNTVGAAFLGLSDSHAEASWRLSIYLASLVSGRWSTWSLVAWSLIAWAINGYVTEWLLETDNA